jgi:hypothetical protein
MRLVDPSAKSGKCNTRRGPFQERAIWWSQSGGPAGPAEPDTGGGLENLDQLIGLPCDVNSSQPAAVAIHYFNPTLTLYCLKPGGPGTAAPDAPAATPTTATETVTDTPITATAPVEVPTSSKAAAATTPRAGPATRTPQGGARAGAVSNPGEVPRRPRSPRY